MDSAFFRAWLERAAAAVEEQRDHLTKLDAAIGDGDHGINLSRGFAAIMAALPEASTPTPGSVLVLAGSTLISKVGGASGPLYGMAFRQAGKALADAADVDAQALAEADTGSGVLVLPDLGSSVLTVRALIAEGGPLPAPLELADAPFVEGAVAAAVAAATGGDIMAVLTAAQEARHARKL